MDNPRHIQRKSLINKSGVEWTDFNCNHYVGCIHNCNYPCYARLISKKKRSEWARVSIVENAMELAVRDIKRVPCGSTIMVSSMTDPYQKIEATEKLTRTLIPILACRGDDAIKVILITKSDLVRRDFALIQEFPNVILCMTITSPENLYDTFEPLAPGNKLRIQCLKEAHKLGIYTIASIEPWIPGVTKPVHLIHKLAPFVNEFIIGSWNHHFRRGSVEQKRVQRTYQNWLPEVLDAAANHMKHILVKEELRNQVDLPKRKPRFVECVEKAKHEVSHGCKGLP